MRKWSQMLQQSAACYNHVETLKDISICLFVCVM